MNLVLRRSGAALCDGLLLFSIYFLILYYDIRRPLPVNLDGAKAGFVLAFSMMTTCELLYRATPGNMLCGLQIYGKDNSACSKEQLICRSFVFWMLIGNGSIVIPNIATALLPLQWEWIFSITIVLIAFLTPMLTILGSKGRMGIHDYLTGVVVLRKDGSSAVDPLSWGLNTAVLVISGLIISFLVANGVQAIAVQANLEGLIRRMPAWERDRKPFIMPTMSYFPHDRANDNRYYIDDYTWLEGDGSDIVVFLSHEKMMSRAIQRRELRDALSDYVPRVDKGERQRWLGVNLIASKFFGFGMRLALARYVVNLETAEIFPWPKVLEPVWDREEDEARVPLVWERPVYYWMIVPTPPLTQWGYPSVESTEGLKNLPER